MRAFGLDSPVLAPRHTSFAGPNLWLLWPALRYRVISPVVHEDSLNVFQEAVLGLFRAGMRDERPIAEMLGLAPELISLVCSDLRGQHLLDQHGVITQAGRAALRDGFADPTANVVTHVFQDGFTGTLLPLEVASPQWARIEWRRERQATLVLGTRGTPLNRPALAVHFGRLPEVDPPTADQIVEMVSRGMHSRREGRDRRWATSAPERVMKRVALIGAPDPTYVPFVLRVDKHRDGGAETTGWSVAHLMTGKPSTYLRRRVATRAHHDALLRERIATLVGRTSEALLAEYDRLDVELRRRIGDALEDRFGTHLRANRELLELMTLIERDIRLTRAPGDHATEIASVAQRCWQVHELVLRAIVGSHPISPRTLHDLRDPVAGRLVRSCSAIGLPSSEFATLKKVRARDLRAKVDHAKTPALLAQCVLSAESGTSEHPFGRLARSYPVLITRLTTMSGDRNSIAHGSPDELNAESAESAWELTQDTVSAYLNLPLFSATLAKESIVG